MDSVREESHHLQRRRSDLAAIAALPNGWGESDPAQVIASLAESLLHTLELACSYVCVRGTTGWTRDILRLPTGLAPVEQRQAIADRLAPLWEGPLPQSFLLALPPNEAVFHWYVLALGPGSDPGLLAVASPRPDFPTEDERLLLSVAVSLTAAVLARKLAETALLQAERSKDEFLAALAHELRNPLAPLRNCLHLFRSFTEPEPSSTKLLEMMERQVQHLVRLVDDLLDLSRITRGNIELQLEEMDLTQAVQTALETARPLIDASHHWLTLDLPDAPLLVRGDAVRLTQVFANLLNNAARYTADSGQIRLSVRREGDQAVVSVQDNGVGIADEMLPRVFDLFTQIDRTRKQSQGGLGVGLALVKILTQLHGGQVEASSQGSGRGSDFRVRLPLVQVPGPCHEEQKPASVQESGVPLLLVDDTQDVVHSLGMVLEVLGYEIRIAYDGPAALRALETYRPAAILLDIGMPGMDGYEVARQVRQRQEWNDIELIALTGWGQEEDKRRSREAGFAHHLVKPVGLEELQRILPSHTASRPLKEPNAP